MDGHTSEDQRAIWERRYREGMTARYPWSIVVSAFMSHKLFGSLQGKRVLEYGCGTASNMSFFADAGMKAFGFDFAEASIKKGVESLESRGYVVSVSADGVFDDRYWDTANGTVVLGVNDFSAFRTTLRFDFVLDRGSLSCMDPGELPQVISKIEAQLAPGGLFVFTPYSHYSLLLPR